MLVRNGQKMPEIGRSDLAENLAFLGGKGVIMKVVGKSIETEQMIIGIGDGAELSRNMRLQKEIEPQNPYLLRECPSCGREVLTIRQKLCDDCKKKNRKKTYRDAYYKKRRNG